MATLTALAFLCGVCGAPALAGDDMILNRPPPDLATYGWTFTGLTLLSLGYGVYAYNKSQDELDQAEKNYKLYKKAGTTSSALKYRAETEDHRDQARNYETRANAAIALTLIFGLTAVYSFGPGLGPNMSLTTSLEGPVFIWRF